MCTTMPSNPTFNKIFQGFTKYFMEILPDIKYTARKLVITKPH